MYSKHKGQLVPILMQMGIDEQQSLTVELHEVHEDLGSMIVRPHSESKTLCSVRVPHLHNAGCLVYRLCYLILPQNIEYMLTG